MRALAAVLVLALGACVAAPDEGDCTGGQRQVCRAEGECRCGTACVPGDACPDTAEGPAGCAARSDGVGICVDLAWLARLPRGRIPCGAGSCDASTQRCVQWSDGAVACAARCADNGPCASGCCTPLADRAGRSLGSVCAPGPGYRCAEDTPAGRSCDPGCGPEARCGVWEGAPRCLPACTADTDCAGTCCAAEGGLRVCLPDARRCAPPPVVAPACTDLDGCVEVTFAALGTRCAAGDSTEVHVRNNCARAADIVICYERREGACACALHRGVAPGAETDPPSWSCGASGRYLVSARAAGDPALCHNGC